MRGKIPTDYGRNKGLAWYSAGWMQSPMFKEPLGAISYPGRLNELGGYMILGVFKT